MNFATDLNIPDFLRNHLGMFAGEKENTCLYDVWMSLVHKHGDLPVINDPYNNISYNFREFTQKITQFAAIVFHNGEQQEINLMKFINY